MPEGVLTFPRRRKEVVLEPRQKEWEVYSDIHARLQETPAMKIGGLEVGVFNLNEESEPFDPSKWYLFSKGKKISKKRKGLKLVPEETTFKLFSLTDLQEYQQKRKVGGGKKLFVPKDSKNLTGKDLKILRYQARDVARGEVVLPAATLSSVTKKQKEVLDGVRISPDHFQKIKKEAGLARTKKRRRKLSRKQQTASTVGLMALAFQVACGPMTPTPAESQTGDAAGKLTLTETPSPTPFAPTSLETSQLESAATPQPTEITEPAEQISEQETYVVQPKDNLYRIALKHNTSVDRLKEANNIPPGSNTIHSGDKLVIPLTQFSEETPQDTVPVTEQSAIKEAAQNPAEILGREFFDNLQEFSEKYRWNDDMVKRYESWKAGQFDPGGEPKRNMVFKMLVSKSAKALLALDQRDLIIPEGQRDIFAQEALLAFEMLRLASDIEQTILSSDFVKDGNGLISDEIVSFLNQGMSFAFEKQFLFEYDVETKSFAYPTPPIKIFKDSDSISPVRIDFKRLKAMSLDLSSNPLSQEEVGAEYWNEFSPQQLAVEKYPNEYSRDYLKLKDWTIYDFDDVEFRDRLPSPLLRGLVESVWERRDEFNIQEILALTSQFEKHLGELHGQEIGVRDGEMIKKILVGYNALTSTVQVSALEAGEVVRSWAEPEASDALDKARARLLYRDTQLLPRSRGDIVLTMLLYLQKNHNLSLKQTAFILGFAGPESHFKDIVWGMGSFEIESLGDEDKYNLIGHSKGGGSPSHSLYGGPGEYYSQDHSLRGVIYGGKEVDPITGQQSFLFYASEEDKNEHKPCMRIVPDKPVDGAGLPDNLIGMTYSANRGRAVTENGGEVGPWQIHPGEIAHAKSFPNAYRWTSGEYLGAVVDASFVRQFPDVEMTAPLPEDDEQEIAKLYWWWNRNSNHYPHYWDDSVFWYSYLNSWEDWDIKKNDEVRQKLRLSNYQPSSGLQEVRISE